MLTVDLPGIGTTTTTTGMTTTKIREGLKIKMKKQVTYLLIMDPKRNNRNKRHFRRRCDV